MRKFLTLVLFMGLLSAHAQLGDSINPVRPDSATTIVSPINMDQNIRGLLALQQEQRARQKKQAIIRIAIGVGMLVILVIGLSRKKRKQ